MNVLVFTFACHHLWKDSTHLCLVFINCPGFATLAQFATLAPNGVGSGHGL